MHERRPPADRRCGQPRTVSFVIATHNRRDVLLGTLERLEAVRAEAAWSEILVVDNASADGTAEAVETTFRQVRVLRSARNLGSCAKALAAHEATGQIVVFLDDDSFPRPGSITAMLERFAGDDTLAAAGFMVHLPDGRLECSALPDVFVGCGVGLRRAALDQVGGLDPGLFMQAEEYDLSFRLVQAGWNVRTFPDLHVDHLKSPRARLSGRTVYYDTRNNLILAARYLPDDLEGIYRRDWAQRYQWIASSCGHRSEYWRARMAGYRRRMAERQAWARWRLGQQAVEQLFRIDQIAGGCADMAAGGLRRIVLADLGKNIWPFVRGACAHGLQILAIADERFAFRNRNYRGIKILSTSEALSLRPEALLVANTSPVHAALAEDRLVQLTDRPIFRWFGYDRPHGPGVVGRSDAAVRNRPVVDEMIKKVLTTSGR